MKLVKYASSVVVLGVIGAMVACSAAAPPASTDEANDTGPGVPVGPEGGAGSTPPGPTGPTDPTPATCGTDDFVKPDLSTLTACGNGKGHCYDKTKVPMADQMVACADASQVCVPDDILEAGGAKLKSCTSIIGPGGCATTGFMPALDMQAAGFLKQDVCDAGQLCVPCNNPQDGNAPTPFCQPIGVHKNACGPASTGDGGAEGGKPLPECCEHKGAKSHGVCLPDSAIPAAQASSTTQQECSTGNKCVPASLVAGKPVACDAGFFGTGFCMDPCFDSTLGFVGDIGLLDGKGCDQNELCIPCSFVSGQGVPGCGS